MRISPYRLSLVVILSVSALASAKSPQPPFSITISAEKPEVKAGSEVFIRIQMKNISDHEVDCSMAPTNGWDAAYQYDVRDAQGTLAERKPLVPGHPEIKEDSSIWPCVLKPGGSNSFDSYIGRRNDMTRPGKYMIQVSRFISGTRKEDGVVKSNTITVTVVP